MNLRLAFRSKSKEEGGSVNFQLNTDIEVMNEVLPKTPMMLVAEVGGYLGLMLGVSVLDLKDFVPATLEFMKGKLCNFYIIIQQK